MTDRPIQNIKQTMFWLSIGTMVYFLAQWLTTILVANITDYKIAGDYALILSSSNIFYAIGLFGMRPYQISDSRHHFSDKVYLISRIITCGIALVACIIFIFFDGFTSIQNICLLIFLIYRITEAGMDVLHGTMQSASRMDIAGKSLIIRGIISIILFCAALVLFKELMPALCLMMLFSIIWLVTFEYTNARKISNKRLGISEKVQAKDVRSLLVACLPLLIGNLVYSLILFVPRYYIEGIYGTDALGVYASISAPALLVPMLAQYIYTPYMPAISEYYIEQKKLTLSRLISKLTIAITLIGVFILLAGFFLGKWGLGILFGESIKEHTYLLVPIIMSVICTAFVYFLNAVIISIRKNSIMLISSGVAIIVCFSLSNILVKSSMNGASYALMVIQISQIIVLALGYILSKRNIKQKPV